MRGATICSGIGAPEAAMPWVDWVFCSEIDPFASAVLAHHYPHVPNRGDMTKFQDWPDEQIDILVGGTPCQSFSVAGLRGGLDDNRGNLALEYLKLARRVRARWLLWENVPGVLSSNGGRDFGAIIGGMVELGYGVAYRVLDAQFFGVPQRRRRVFVVGYLGDWRRAAAVLFERHSLSRHPAPRREKGQNAPTIPSRSSAGGGLGTDFDCDGGLIPSTGDTSHCLNAGGMGRQDYETETLIAFTAKDHGADASDISPTLRSGSHSGSHANGGVMPAVAFMENQQAQVWDADCVQALNKGGGKLGQGYPAIRQASAVRRLTPMECERLQGFPDDYTAVPYRGKPAADGPRYKALGNSMAVPVICWIGDRIQMVENLSEERLAA